MSVYVDGDRCPVSVMRHAFVEYDLGYTKRTVHDVVEEGCGNELPCVHHGSAKMVNAMPPHLMYKAPT